MKCMLHPLVGPSPSMFRPRVILLQENARVIIKRTVKQGENSSEVLIRDQDNRRQTIQNASSGQEGTSTALKSEKTHIWVHHEPSFEIT